MKKLEAVQALRVFDKQGKYVFTKHDMAKLFPQDTSRTLDESLKRLVEANIIKRAF